MLASRLEGSSAQDLIGMKKNEDEKLMVIRCKACNRCFDTTFTPSELASLPVNQFEAGTLHLCPHCGHLATYLLSDYMESSD